MDKQQKAAQELSGEEMKAINGGSGLLDRLPVLGDLLGSSSDTGREAGNDTRDSNTDRYGEGNGGGLLGGLL